MFCFLMELNSWLWTNTGKTQSLEAPKSLVVFRGGFRQTLAAVRLCKALCDLYTLSSCAGYLTPPSTPAIFPVLFSQVYMPNPF